MSIDTSVGRVEGVRVSIDTSVQVSGQGSVFAESWAERRVVNVSVSVIADRCALAAALGTSGAAPCGAACLRRLPALGGRVVLLDSQCARCL